MNRAVDRTDMQVALHHATQARLKAHKRIVCSFTAQVVGVGMGPSEHDIKTFSRLVGIEYRLARLYAQASIAIVGRR